MVRELNTKEEFEQATVRMPAEDHTLSPSVLKHVLRATCPPQWQSETYPCSDNHAYLSSSATSAARALPEQEITTTKASQNLEPGHGVSR